MLRDASHQQVIEKFSFIYTLTLSGSVNSSQQQLTEELTVNRQKFSGRAPSLAATSAKLKQEDIIAPNSSSLVSSPAIASSINGQGDRTDSTSNFSEIVKFSAANPENHLPQSQPNYLGKILFALSCGYLMFVLWWLFGNKSGQWFAMLTGKRQISISQSDAEFIDYVERSLSAIDRKIQASKTRENDSKSESQVVYVPVYTPTTPTPAPPQLPASNPTISLPNNSATTIPKPINASPTPPPTPSSVAKIPAPPPLPAPTPMPKSSSPKSEAPVVATTISKPAIKHTLIGILELEDKSAALFKVNGMTKRIWLGEEINGSGWILESVDNQKAKISHQGTIRSLNVGETF